MTAVDLAADCGRDGNPNRAAIDYPDSPNMDLLARIPSSALSILDVGCGTGALGAAYRDMKPNTRLFGIERDPDAAAVAGQRLDVVACADVERSPLPFDLPEGIDCLIYGDVLQQLRDPLAVLRRHLDLLNPNGTVLICVPNAEHWSMAARLLRGTWDYEPAGLLDTRHLRWFSLRTVTRMLTDAGLAVEEAHPRIFATEQAQQFVETLTPGLRALGVAPREYVPRALPLQYVLRARRDGPAPVVPARADHGVDNAAPAVVARSSAELAPRREVLAADIAREIVYLERSVPFAGRSDLELGPTFTDETAQPFACPGHTADIRSFRFRNVTLETASMLLFDHDRPIKETHYLLHDSQYRDARISPNRLVEVPEGQSYIVGCNKGHANYYHWLIQALPAMDLGVRACGGSQPNLALPPLTLWQERSLELLNLAALPRLTLDSASQYLLPHAKYSEFLNGSTAFRVSGRAVETFRRMQSMVPSKPSRHAVIYVARTDSAHRVASNEVELIRRLEQEDVGIIVPGSLSLDDQINTFRAARLVIGPHGAGLSNVVFCEPGAVLYELIPQHYRNSCINRLALAASIHYTADLFSSSAEGWEHDRIWQYDLDRILDRVRKLKSRFQQAPPSMIAARPAPQEEMPLKDLLMNFESLGDNCEFGLVQRQGGAEPLGLLRFASPYVPVEIRAETIAAALRNRFTGLGEASTVRVVLAGESHPRELIVRESAYQLMHHTFSHEGEVDPEDFRLKEARRLTFLRDKLLADLAAAEKIWVWKSNVAQSNEQIAGLLDAISTYGPNVLLWMVTADAAHPPGSVERVTPGLLKGFVTRFAPYASARDIAFDEWYKVCRNAYSLWRKKSPLAGLEGEVSPAVADASGCATLPVPTTDCSSIGPLATSAICKPLSGASPDGPQVDFQPISQPFSLRDAGSYREFAASNERFLQQAKLGYYDFLDLGTRDAGGFVVGSQLGGSKGLGFDTDPVSVRKNLDAGRDVVCMDVAALGTLSLRSKFAVCHHILEHLPSIYEVGNVIGALARSCSDFLFIAGPCFDHENDLYGRGLKAFHSAMLDHTCRFTTPDLMALLYGLGLRRYAIGVSLPMQNSDSEFLVSAVAPNEVWRWEALRALPRPRVTFDPVLYRDIVCAVALDDALDPIVKLMSYTFAQQKVEKVVHVANW